jgi:hypothetical protein
MDGNVNLDSLPLFPLPPDSFKRKGGFPFLLPGEGNFVTNESRKRKMDATLVMGIRRRFEHPIEAGVQKSPPNKGMP